jgi:ubiquinone/menaquinone biosynthesis C-methylase UbiE
MDLAYLENYWPKAVNWYQDYFSKFSIKMYETIAPFLVLEKAKKIIEIGGGLGLGARVIIPHLSPTATYTLTNHVSCLTDLAKSYNLPQTESIKVDPLSLPFASESFDRFIAMAAFEELSDASTAIKEAYRVLEPGGILAASVTGKNPRKP